MTYTYPTDSFLHEQGRVPPEGVAAAALAIRIRLNREKTARQPRTRHHAHTRDCRQPGVRESYARAHEPAWSEDR